jgi:hypothetical protein
LAPKMSLSPLYHELKLRMRPKYHKLENFKAGAKIWGFTFDCFEISIVVIWTKVGSWNCPTFKGQDIQTVVNPNLFHNSKAATETENFWKLSWWIFFQKTLSILLPFHFSWVPAQLAIRVALHSVSPNLDRYKLLHSKH